MSDMDVMSYQRFWIGNRTNNCVNYLTIGPYTKLKVFFLTVMAGVL